MNAATAIERTARHCILAVFVPFAANGCALTSKADLVGIRHYSPERMQRPALANNAAAPAPNAALAMRLGRVSSGAHLRERIAYRESLFEVGYYEDQRWTERPEVFVRRKLARTLFEEQGFSRALGGAAPTLDVEVVSFDELRPPQGRGVRIELKMVLYEDRAVLLEHTVTIDRAVGSSNEKTSMEAIVAAMADALDGAAEQVATRVKAALLSRARERAALP